jgi:hypothetical protein
MDVTEEPEEVEEEPDLSELIASNLSKNGSYDMSLLVGEWS